MTEVCLTSVPHARLVRVHYERRRAIKGWWMVHNGPSPALWPVQEFGPYWTLLVCRLRTARYCDKIISDIETRERQYGHRIEVELRA